MHACCKYEGISDFLGHAGVGHDLSDDDDGDDGQVREAQADEVIFEDLSDLTDGSTLIEAAEDGGDEIMTPGTAIHVKV